MTASFKMPPGVMSVAITDPDTAPNAVLTKMKVSAPDVGYELHFLRRGTEADWLTLAQKLERSGAYAIVRRVALSLHDPA